MGKSRKSKNRKAGTRYCMICNPEFGNTWNFQTLVKTFHCDCGCEGWYCATHLKTHKNPTRYCKVCNPENDFTEKLQTFMETFKCGCGCEGWYCANHLKAHKLDPGCEFKCAECGITIKHNNYCEECKKHLCWAHLDKQFHKCNVESIPSEGNKPGVVINYTTKGWRGE